MALSPTLQAICDVIRPEHTQTPAVIRLEETSPSSTCPPVVITKSGPAVVLKLDTPGAWTCPRQDCPLPLAPNQRLFPLFRSERGGLTQICDFIVFYQPREDEDAALYVLLCELKSSRGDGAMKQIENGKLLAEYILAITEHHGLRQALPRVEYRGVLFYQPKGVREPRGGQRRAACPYQRHGRMADLGVAVLPPVPQRDIAYFCVDSLAP